MEKTKATECHLIIIFSACPVDALMNKVQKVVKTKIIKKKNAAV